MSSFSVGHLIKKSALDIGVQYACVAGGATVAVAVVAAGLRIIRGSTPDADTGQLAMALAFFLVPLLVWISISLWRRNPTQGEPAVPQKSETDEHKALGALTDLMLGAQLSARRAALAGAALQSLRDSKSRTLGLEEFKVRTALRRRDEELISDLRRLVKTEDLDKTHERMLALLLRMEEESYAARKRAAASLWRQLSDDDEPARGRLLALLTMSGMPAKRASRRGRSSSRKEQLAPPQKP